ncbi:MAG: hypothetical protein HY841_03920 [Bacteroidetes bacterium]|nr:hypothetical protein [Bacteroidota bacterium]
MNEKNFLEEILKDKDGSYNLREVVTLVFVAITIISWIGEQFFGIVVPEYMFYSFVSLVGAGCFGYSIERKTRLPDGQAKSNLNNQNEKQP